MSSTNKANRRRLRAIIFEVEEGWMGVCLEHWLFAQAESHATIYGELERVIQVHVQVAREKGKEPFVYLPPAPRRFREMFDSPSAQAGPTLLIQLPADAEAVAPELVVRETAA